MGDFVSISETSCPGISGLTLLLFPTRRGDLLKPTYEWVGGGGNYPLELNQCPGPLRTTAAWSLHSRACSRDSYVTAMPLCILNVHELQLCH